MMIKLLSSWKKKGIEQQKTSNPRTKSKKRWNFSSKKRKGAVYLRVLRDYDEESGRWKLMIHAVLASGPCLFEF